MYNKPNDPETKHVMCQGVKCIFPSTCGWNRSTFLLNLLHSSFLVFTFYWYFDILGYSRESCTLLLEYNIFWSFKVFDYITIILDYQIPFDNLWLRVYLWSNARSGQFDVSRYEYSYFTKKHYIDCLSNSSHLGAGVTAHL